MQLRGINETLRSDAMRLAFKKSGYKLREKRVAWPRTRGPIGIRVEVKTGYAVEFVRQ